MIDENKEGAHDHYLGEFAKRNEQLVAFVESASLAIKAVSEVISEKDHSHAHLKISEAARQLKVMAEALRDANEHHKSSMQ